MADCGANSALRNLHRLPSGGDALHRGARGGDVIRLQAVYSAVAMGGSIAVMTVFAGFLYQHGARCVLGDGAGRFTGHRYSP